VNILHIYKDYFPIVGGIENHIKLLAEAQAARGHSVTVLVTSLNRHAHVETSNGVRVIFASRLFNLSSAPFSLEMFRHLAQLETDIAHLHSPYPFGEMAQYFFGHARATILTYHSDIVRQRVMGALYTPFLHRVLARVNTIIATSPNYIESSRVLRACREKCVVVPLASPPHPSSQNQTAILRRGGVSGLSHLLFVGRLRYYKGVNYLLEAMPFLPMARLTIVGTGPMEREWKELADSLEIARRVTWAGEVSDTELGAYYEACDIFVLPCSERSEAFGAVQLEAMAAGKPVVSCDVDTGVAWVNQNEITGLVVPPKNPLALGAAVSRLMQDEALRERMGQAGRERVETEFTVEKMVERAMQVYQNALTARPS
jgi:glycosyltransferase involved in cell wall biosynthesis